MMGMVGRRTGRPALAAVGAIAGMAAGAGAALAQQPREWGLGMQDAHSPVMQQMDEFHDILLVIIFAISVFVLGLLLYAVWRFREKAHPVPTRTTHNSVLEVMWTAIPVLILVVIGVISLPLLYETDRTVDADMTIKAVGNQWFWTYEYPDHGDFAFDSFMVPDDELEAGQPRLLATDEDVVVPVGTKVRVLVTASDVLHAWAVPAFGVKIDAVPGRTNETWFLATNPGVYYGQCSELCGKDHSFMPITVRAVPQAEFDAWVRDARERFAGAAPAGIRPVQFVRNEVARRAPGEDAR